MLRLPSSFVLRIAAWAMLAASQTAAVSSKLITDGLPASAPLSRTQTNSGAETGDAEHLVPDRELADGSADGRDLSGELHAEDSLPTARRMTCADAHAQMRESRRQTHDCKRQVGSPKDDAAATRSGVPSQRRCSF